MVSFPATLMPEIIKIGCWTGRLKTQVRKTKVPGDGICKYGIRKYEYARVENASTENASTNLQRWKT